MTCAANSCCKRLFNIIESYRSAPILVAAIVALVSTVALSPGSTNAHVVSEKPWHPVAAAYRTMLFLSNLQPVPWPLITDAYREAHPAATDSRPAKAYFTKAGNRIDLAIERAIEAKDRHALFAASTRGVSRMIRSAIADAGRNLPDRGAMPKLKEAQAIYRAFADVLAQVDRDSYRRLGLAWLKLSSSNGSNGLLGAGEVRADPERFGKAEKQIADYLAENYEPKSFTQRNTYHPILRRLSPDKAR